MRTFTTTVIVALCFLLIGAPAWGQTPFYDGFTGTGNVGGSGAVGSTSNGWTTHSGTAGTIDIVTGSLSYTGLQASTGDKVYVVGNNTTNSRDVNAPISLGSATVAYFSTLVNIVDNTQLGTTGDYFMHFGQTAGSAVTIFAGRLGIKSVNSGANFRFAIQNTSGGTPTYTDFATDLSFGTTYLVVVKVDINVSPIVATLWVNPASLGGTEPAGGVTNNSGSGAFTGFASICIREGAATPKANYDEIRAGLTWASVTPLSAGGTATKLSIPSVNGGTSPTANAPFSVVVQSLDNSNAPAPVTQNTDVSLSLASGHGTLGGALTGTILSGQNSVTIAGATYDIVESGVSITVTRTSGDVLTPGTSSLFAVLEAASQLAFVGVPAGGNPNTNLTQFTVEARRRDNSIDATFTGTITLAKASGPGNVSGTLSRAAVAGVATFNDIQMDAVGSYTLSASSAPLIGATSSSISITSNALPIVEEFIYTSGTTLVSNGWTAHSGAGTNSIAVTTPGLTYTGYATGIGNAASMTTSGEDVSRTFAQAISGTVYASFLVNLSAVQTAGDYFFHFAQFPVSGNIFVCRVFAKGDGLGGVAFGLAKSSSSTSYTAFSYALNTTYLIIVRYTFNTGATTDDQVDMWINPPLLPPDPTATLTVTDASTDPSNLGVFALRQGSASNAGTLVIDAIRIATTWPEGPVPIQLASFTGAAISNNAVQLDWVTLSEVNNFGFYIHRRNATEHTFTELPNSFIPGHGTTLIPQYYTFTDNTAGVGRWFYRLKQVDLDGTITLTDPIQVDVLTGVGEVAPQEFALNQNYPNPFNPETNIKFSVETAGRTTLEIYNILGQKVATLFDDVAEVSRYYVVKFSGLGMTSGVYFYTLESGQKKDIKKMLLLK